MRLILAFACINLSFYSVASELKYSVASIPAELKENANVVVREDHMKFRIIEKNRALQYVHYVVTILNEKGKDYSGYSVGYDKLTKITDFNGAVYDSEGKQIRKLKSKEINDRASFDGFTLFSDNRIKWIDLSQSTYPYTVEIEYEIEYKFLYYIPGSWWGRENVSYQHASYELSYPPLLAPRYKVFNIEAKPIKKQIEPGIESLTWTLENIKPIKKEAFDPPAAQVVPHIIAAPTEFEFEGYAGKMDSWEHFGKWILSLNQGRDILPEETKQKVQSITSGLKTNEEKVRVLYTYLQEKTRYVGIQLGIGGYQPFEAGIVDKNGYGDCKALSNYMVALLKQAGIPSNYVLIKAGDEKSMEIDFPSTQFNHAIVAVPNGKDTLWLECTSQTKPFGYMGNFTGDRFALMITTDGGKIVKTPTNKTEQNKQYRTSHVYLTSTGNAKASVVTLYSGLQYENDGLDFILTSQHDDQKKWLQENISIPSFEVSNFSMVNVKDKIPSATVKVDLILNRYASVSGKRLFMTPNLMNRSSYIPPQNSNRKNPVVRKSSFIDIDSINYHVPEEIYPEFLPPQVKITNRFGEYEATFQFEQGKLLYIRKLKMVPGEFPADSYKELIEFYKTINKMDNLKIVFLNKT